MSLGDSTISTDSSVVVVVGSREVLAVPHIGQNDAVCINYFRIRPTEGRRKMGKRNCRPYEPVYKRNKILSRDEKPVLPATDQYHTSCCVHFSLEEIKSSSPLYQVPTEVEKAVFTKKSKI